ncbi:hypothetical protein [Actinomadura sp. HBU206391]|uniref:hypothetical protein n=1 Tax=Actinomadura sp. HBU206391 TaxID=2731692 RepID=UPI00164F8673|nr:hypothetical protein [Actinomadura sp. HBU206391]MBC6458206.1 hypothetical protein [Actinomadura sp. HBU206391]
MKLRAAGDLGDLGKGRSSRDRRRRRWMLLAPLAPLAVVDIALVIGGMAFESPSPVASWTAVPASLSPAARTAAAHSCQERLSGQPRSLDAAGLKEVVAEDRGGLTAVLMSGSGRYGMCVGEPGAPLFVGAGDAGRLTGDGIVLGGAPVRIDRSARIDRSVPFRVAYGKATSKVSTVVITTADRRLVTATISAGHYLAWWPSDADPVTITATAADGRIIEVLRPDPRG